MGSAPRAPCMSSFANASTASPCSAASVRPRAADLRDLPPAGDRDGPPRLGARRGARRRAAAGDAARACAISSPSLSACSPRARDRSSAWDSVSGRRRLRLDAAARRPTDLPARHAASEREPGAHRAGICPRGSPPSALVGECGRARGGAGRFARDRVPGSRRRSVPHSWCSGWHHSH